MDVSGNAALHANSERHFTASWKLSSTKVNCRSKTVPNRLPEAGYAAAAERVHFRLTHDVRARLKGELDDLRIGVGSGHLKDTEDVLPARADVLRLRFDEVRHASDDHIANSRGSTRQR